MDFTLKSLTLKTKSILDPRTRYLNGDSGTSLDSRVAR